MISTAVSRPQLLLVEDNRADAALVRHLVRDRFGGDIYDVVRVSTLDEAMHEVGTRPFVCILLDLGLPDVDGIDTVRALRPAAPTVPLVVLTGRDDEQFGVEALQSGAQDYLIKGELEGRALTRAICFAVERVRMSRPEAPAAADTCAGHSLPFDMSF